MQQRLSPRPATAPSPEHQATADRAEQRGVDRYAHWHWGWIGIFVEILGLARSANERDLDQVCRHARHLQAIVERLRPQGSAA